MAHPRMFRYGTTTIWRRHLRVLPLNCSEETMFTFVIISKDGRQIFSHSEPTYDALVKWGLASDEDTPADADHWQIKDPDGNIIEMRRMNGMRKL